tara:strand:- start:32 stop:1126 length:1095 start_codon:yes stop_codon:yes gene_type:complete
MKGKEMKKDNLLFSLDGIAKPWLLNKHGYPFFPFTLNGHIKTLNLNEIGLIASAEPDVSGQCSLAVLPRSNDVYKTLFEDLDDPVQPRGGEGMREIQKFKRDLLHKNILNSKEGSFESEWSLFFEKPVFILFLDKQFRIVLEHKHFFKKQRLKKYKLYKISLKFSENFGEKAEKSSYFKKTVLNSGFFEERKIEKIYYGITKRDVFQRFLEHKKKAEENSGYIFHKTWHKWSKHLSIIGDNFNVYLSVIKDSDSLDEIYDYEEAFVGYDSLHPLGLNAIPGGHAGIQELHKLKLLKSTKNVSLKEREKAVEKFIQKGYKIENRKLPMPHDRKEHKRVLRSGRVIDVRACKVKGGQSYVRSGKIH